MTLRDVHERRVAVNSLGHKRVCLSLADRLWRHVDKSGGPDACWPYTGAKSSTGYGSLGGNSGGGAHRVAYEAANGPILDGLLQVCHHCDNPPCCNPAHLFLGTALDNSLDMVSKGRAVDTRNERSPRARLINAQVAEIRRRWAGGETLKSLAPEFGVSTSYLSRMMRGERRPLEGDESLPARPPAMPATPVTPARVAARERRRVESEAAAAARAQSAERHRRRAAEMVRLYEAGFSTTEVGERVGLDASGVSRALRAAGVQMRPRNKLFYLPGIDRDAVREMHAASVRVKEMCRRLSVGPDRINQVLDELRLPRFGPGNPQVVTTKIHQEASAA